MHCILNQPILCRAITGEESDLKLTLITVGCSPVRELRLLDQPDDLWPQVLRAFQIEILRQLTYTFFESFGAQGLVTRAAAAARVIEDLVFDSLVFSHWKACSKFFDA